MDRKRLICVGANSESEIALKGLSEQDANIVGLVTMQTDKSQTICDYVDLRSFCSKLGIPVIETNNINSESTLEKIGRLNADYIFVLGWSQLFNRDLLALPTGFVVGSHPTPLPEGRGRAPVPWTILENKRRSAVTLFRMDEGVDSGAIVGQQWFDVPEGIYAAELYQLVAQNLCIAVCRLYEKLQYGSVDEIEQDESNISYRSKRTPADGIIDFTKDASSIERLVRAVSRPYPGAYSFFNSTKICIWKASLKGLPCRKGLPGQILTRDSSRLLVQCGDGPLWLEEFTALNQPVSSDWFKVGAKFGFAVQDEIYRLLRQIEILQRELNDAGHE